MRITKHTTSKSSPSNATDDEGDAPGGVNQSLLMGEIVAEPECRLLPSGSTALSFSLTVRVRDAKTTSVPVVWYDPPKAAGSWTGGDLVIVHGSVVRRFFRGGGGLGSSTEVVVKRAALHRQRSKRHAVISRAMADLHTATAGAHR